MYSSYRKQCPQRNLSYIIKPGETFYSLAEKYHTTVPALIWANPAINPSYLRVGQKILIPGEQKHPHCPEGNYYTIRPGDNFKEIAKFFNVSPKDLLEANPVIEPKKLFEGQVIYIPETLAL